MTRVAINGFGRIGRLVFKLLIHSPEVEIVAINDLTDIASLVHLLKYDSVHGRFDANIEIAADGLIVDGKKVKIVAESNPAQIPWKTLDIDIVIESTGLFTHINDASKHIEAGAKQVIISAPGKGEVPTFVLGVNDHLIDPNQKWLNISDRFNARWQDSQWILAYRLLLRRSCSHHCCCPHLNQTSQQGGAAFYLP